MALFLIEKRADKLYKLKRIPLEASLCRTLKRY